MVKIWTLLFSSWDSLICCILKMTVSIELTDCIVIVVQYLSVRLTSYSISLTFNFWEFIAVYLFNCTSTILYNRMSQQNVILPCSCFYRITCHLYMVCHFDMEKLGQYHQTQCYRFLKTQNWLAQSLKDRIYWA